MDARRLWGDEQNSSPTTERNEPSEPFGAMGCLSQGAEMDFPTFSVASG